MESFSIIECPSPVIATAIHAGHALRSDTATQIALADSERTREEDPVTERIADIGHALVVVHSSRFEVDLNRPRDSAVYRTPDQAWGLEVWHSGCAEETVAASLDIYDRFYREMHALITRTIAAYGYALVLDIHSYNHRRGGPDAPVDDPGLNPDVNLGTGTLDRVFWAPVIDSFAASLAGDGYDARENVKFRGGQFPRWIHEEFPGSAMALAVEFKKAFMDEWTAKIDESAVQRANGALRRAASAAQTAAQELQGT